MKRAPFLLFALLFLPARAFAEPTNIEDQSLDRLLDVKLEERLGTTTAVSKRDESVLRAPATVTTFDADRIRLSGAGSVVDVLRWVPGVQVVRVAPGNFVVSLRGTGGLTGNDLVVLLDGILLNSPLDGSVPWDAFPVEVGDIERIEVVRGPVSPIYGPNAYTGVVNIVTKDAGYTPTTVGLRSQAGLDGNGVSLSSTGGRITHNGERSKAAWYWTTRYDNTSGSGSSTPWLMYGSAGRLAYAVTKHSTLSLEVTGAHAKRSELDHLSLRDRDLGRSQGTALLKYTAVGERVDTSVWTRANWLFFGRADRADDDFSYARTRGTRAEAGADLTLKADWLRATMGASYIGEYVDAPYINPTDNAATRRGWGVFGSATAAATKWLDASLAVRGDVAPTISALQGSYRASVVAHSETTAVRLSAASAYRAPSWIEAAGRFTDVRTGLILLDGTPTIAPPRNDAVELGLVWGPSVDFQLKPTLYASRLTHVVVEDFAPLVRKSFENETSDRWIAGGELEASWRLRENVTAEGFAGVLAYPDAPPSSATIGVPGQNSKTTAGARLQWTTLRERLAGSFGARAYSARDYLVRAGIPPEIRTFHVPMTVTLEAMGEFRPFGKEPVWTTLRFQSNLPKPVFESPLPGASSLGTSVLLGLEYRE